MNDLVTIITVTFAYVGLITTFKAIKRSVVGQAFIKACRENGFTFDGIMAVITIIIPGICAVGFALWVLGEKLVGLLK